MTPREPAATGGRFGPNTADVEGLIARAGDLTEAEAERIATVHRAAVADAGSFREALRAVVVAAHEAGREQQMLLAEQAANRAVTMFAGSARRDLIGGVIGRLAEATVVAGLVSPEILSPLTSPWTRVID